MLRLAAPLNERLRRAVAGRAASLESLLNWASAERAATRPLLWLHAPSVGEALMAQAILARVRARRADVQAIFTFFSPSAERIAPRVGADWSGYLPWDTTPVLRRVLDAARPDCIAFVRSEIWPVLTREATERRARVLLVNAVLAEDSSRIGATARMVLGPSYRRLHAIGAVSADDAARFSVLNVLHERVHVTGDARFDQVAERVQSIDRSRALLHSLLSHRGPWLVAGSTWREDEERMISALAQLEPRGVKWRAIIAPHEPTRAHIEALEARLTAAKLSHAALPHDDEAIHTNAAVLIVNRVGVLSELYAVADTAYVGGGFGDQGLHSVVEPAALGVPVLFGPKHGNAREAGRLAAAGGGHVVHTVVELRDTLARWLRDESTRQRVGAAARAFVQSHTGGADTNAELIAGAFNPAVR